jgi:hypothetical protein
VHQVRKGAVLWLWRGFAKGKRTCFFFLHVYSVCWLYWTLH